MMSEKRNERVCIVGAGPVGLSLALRLADFGIQAVLFDNNRGLKVEGSKACLIQGDVVEILDKSGCAARVYEDGVPWSTSNVYIGGDNILRAAYPTTNRYGPFVNISQYRIEEILLEEIQRRPELAVHWSSSVVGLAQDETGVTVDIERDGQIQQQRFSYVVACNGQRSNLRDLVGAVWLGYRHTAQFLITDIKARLPLPKERHFHFDPPFNRGYQVIMHPQPNDVWRIDWQLPPDVDVEADRQNGNLERRIRSVIGNVDYSLEWLSVYRFQQRKVDQFVKGRVLFAGDAAHALPPYGSRGMNSGIQDADNLAWKLALVMQGVAQPSLLDTYHDERYAAAEENIDVTERTIRFMVPSSPLVKLRRTVLFALARRFPRMRKHVNSGTMARPHRYVNSRLVRGHDQQPVVGTFVQDTDVTLSGQTLKLRELLGRGFCLLYIGEQAPAVLPPVLRGFGSLPTSVLVLGTLKRPDVPWPAHIQWGRIAPHALSQYAANHWHLVRPDMHIASVQCIDQREDFDTLLLAGLADTLTPFSAHPAVSAPVVPLGTATPTPPSDEADRLVA